MQLARWLQLDLVAPADARASEAKTGAARDGERARVHARLRAVLEHGMWAAAAARPPFEPDNVLATQPLRALLPAPADGAPRPCVAGSTWAEPKVKPSALAQLWASAGSMRTYIDRLVTQLLKPDSEFRMVYGVRASAADTEPCTVPLSATPKQPKKTDADWDAEYAAAASAAGTDAARKPGTGALLDLLANLLSPGVRPGLPASSGALAAHVAAVDTAREALAKQEGWDAAKLGEHLACARECKRVAGMLRACNEGAAGDACRRNALETSCPAKAVPGCADAKRGINSNSGMLAELAAGGGGGTPATADAVCRRTVCSPAAAAAAPLPPTSSAMCSKKTPKARSVSAASAAWSRKRTQTFV
jgi:hypothetical protein